jgi:hypothetical protein
MGGATQITWLYTASNSNALNKENDMNWIKNLWLKWFGTGTEDDWRNPFWRVTEASDVKPIWSVYLIDLRLFFQRAGKWKCYLSFNKPVTQNFWNSVFSFNIYITKAKWMTAWPIIYIFLNALLLGIILGIKTLFCLALSWSISVDWMLWFYIWLAMEILCCFVHPRFGIVIRPLHDWYFEAGAGILFDRGEMGIKFNVYHNEGSDAKGWDEGSV